MGYHVHKKRRMISIVLVSAAAIVVTGCIIFAILTNNGEKNSSSHEDMTSSEQTTTVTTASTTTVPSVTTSQTDSNIQASDEVIAAFKSVDFYRSQNLNRYLTYKNKNTKLPYEQVILNVNIGLDNAFYTNTKPISDPASITVLVNKFNNLPSDYVPSDLVKISAENSARELYLKKDAAEAFEKLCNDAKAQGYTIKAYSTYRSYNTQLNTYNGYVKSDGQTNADTYSAKAGFSEHQTGLAADVQGSTGAYNQFSSTKEYKYVQDNSYKYGFIIRYPEGKQSITGYMAEAWHLRYVGVDIATRIHNEKITYDEYCAKYTTK